MQWSQAKAIGSRKTAQELRWRVGGEAASRERQAWKPAVSASRATYKCAGKVGSGSEKYRAEDGSCCREHTKELAILHSKYKPELRAYGQAVLLTPG